MNPNIFRQFSIRGIADQDLLDEEVEAIGAAIGMFFSQKNVTDVLVSHDIRLSSERISRALIRGLCNSPINITNTGLTPTPVHNFAVDNIGAGGGVMITASHNPAEYNGLKMRDEHTLSEDDIQRIYQFSQSAQTGTTSNDCRAQEYDPLPDYIEHLKRLIKLHQPLSLVIDGGNGANGPIVSRLLRELGCTVIEMNMDLDGAFPGRGPDPTKKSALNALAQSVRDHNAQLGVAYDGDGDRLAVVDELGQRIQGDQILMLLARELLKDGPAKIVYELLCTQALADDVSAHGGEPIMTPSGYAFVHEVMQEVGGALGGELSGHLFFNEPKFRFDDAILATVKLLNVISANPIPVSEQFAALPSYSSSPQIRLDCPDELKADIVSFVYDRYHGQYRVDTIDGARIHFPDGWATVRQSNTQPVISMRFEARSELALARIQAEVQSVVEQEIEQRTKEALS